MILYIQFIWVSASATEYQQCHCS